MRYFEILYYKTHYWIAKKYVKTEYGASDSIRKSGLKRSIIDVVELTEDEYIQYKSKQDNLIKQKKENKFII